MLVYVVLRKNKHNGDDRPWTDSIKSKRYLGVVNHLCRPDYCVTVLCFGFLRLAEQVLLDWIMYKTEFMASTGMCMFTLTVLRFDG